MTTLEKNPDAPVTPAQARKAMLFWASLIVGLLLLEVTLCVAGIVAATRTNPPVVKDYYNKALNWDARNQTTQPSPTP